MTDINKTVRENIRRFRHEADLTQEKLALKTGLHRAYIGQVERGEKRIGLTNLQIIADCLGRHIRDFVS